MNSIAEDREQLKQLLSDCPFFFDSEIHERIGSTNDRGRELAEEGAPEGMVILAHEQTKGRGRMGRTFYSPCAVGLYMSVILRPGSIENIASLVTACAAVATRRAIQRLTGKSVQIKWVNDLYAEGKKLCGILAEGKFTPEGQLSYLVLGIGVNLSPPAGGYHPEIDGKTISLSEFAPGFSLTPPALGAEIIRVFGEIYRALPDRSFLEEYRDSSCVLGKSISYFKGDQQFFAMAQAIGKNGELIVRFPDGSQEILSAGEVRFVREC